MERRIQGFFWPAGGFFVDDLFARRRTGGPVYADRQLVVTRTDNPTGLRFAGEIDMSNSTAVGDSVRLACESRANPHLDLTNLSFCDISGIRALVQAAHDLTDGRRLLLHGLPEQLQTVIRVTGWSEVPSLVLCGCEGEQ